MSALIVKKVGPHEWRIIRQSSKLDKIKSKDRTGLVWENKKIRVMIQSWPQFDAPSEGLCRFYLRGNEPIHEDMIFSVPDNKEAIFKNAVLEINKLHSNNSNIEMDEVVLEDKN